MAPPRVRRLVGGRLPKRWRNELYRLRTFGPSDYSRTKWRQLSRRAPVPLAGAPFEIGAPAPIVLHASTVKAVRSHWVDVGPGRRELRAFTRVAHGHCVFLDIGAAQGIFSAAFCALTGERAYALEPSPEMFRELTALMAQNPDFKIAPFKIAVGASEGVQRVESFGAQFRGVDGQQEGAPTMNVETLDGFVERNELTPDFVKIDVEGMEREVLRGGAKAFSGPVRVIMLEVHSQMLLGEGNVSDIQPLLESYGFRLFTLDFDPISDLAEYSASGREGRLPATNIICAKEGREFGEA